MDTQAITGRPESGDVKASAVVKPDAEPLGAAYCLTPEQAYFFKAETGIDEDDKLRDHILEVQAKAYEIFPYLCIRWLTFLRIGIAKLPVYERIIKLGQEHPDAIFLDLGCCFGVDSRKVVADGFPLRNVVTMDLKEGFFHLGHTLFNTTPQTYPINFVAGDVFDPNILKMVSHLDKSPSGEKPDLSALTSLNPLAGRCSVIHASNFFHMFSEENQLRLAKALAGLLSPRPGSMICGEHVGNSQKGVFQEQITGGRVFQMFQHCPESWNAMWEREVFSEGQVRVDAELHQAEKSGTTFYELRWSVMRL